MLISNAIKKLERAGWVVKAQRAIVEMDMAWQARKPDSLYCIEFIRNGREPELTCLSVRKLTDEDHIQSDYIAGTYVDSIPQAIRLIECTAKYNKPA